MNTFSDGAPARDKSLKFRMIMTSDVITLAEHPLVPYIIDSPQSAAIRSVALLALALALALLEHVQESLSPGNRHNSENPLGTHNCEQTDKRAASQYVHMIVS
jgi:hypothetical protein